MDNKRRRNIENAPEIELFLKHTRFEALWQTLKNIHGKKAFLWLENLPRTLANLLHEKTWTLGNSEYPLSYNLVIEVSEGVLKIGVPHTSFVHEIQTLRCYQHYSGIANLKQYDRNLAYLLLEKLEPLNWSVFNDQEKTVKMAGIMRDFHTFYRENNTDLWTATAPPRSKCLRHYYKGFLRYHARHQSGVAPYDAKLIEQAEQLFLYLCETAPESVLLHGDLHAKNVLQKAGQPIIIDPKGVWGDPAFEPTDFLFNDLPNAHSQRSACLQQRISIFSEQMCSLTEEKEMFLRILQRAFAQGVLSAVWHDEDLEDGSNAIQTAVILKELLDNVKT